MTFYEVAGDQLIMRRVEWAVDGCGESGVDLIDGTAGVEAAAR